MSLAYRVEVSDALPKNLISDLGTRPIDGWLKPRYTERVWIEAGNPRKSWEIPCFYETKGMAPNGASKIAVRTNVGRVHELYVVRVWDENGMREPRGGEFNYYTNDRTARVDLAVPNFESDPEVTPRFVITPNRIFGQGSSDARKVNLQDPTIVNMTNFLRQRYEDINPVGRPDIPLQKIMEGAPLFPLDITEVKDLPFPNPDYMEEIGKKEVEEAPQGALKRVWFGGTDLYGQKLAWHDVGIPLLKGARRISVKTFLDTTHMDFEKHWVGESIKDPDYNDLLRKKCITVKLRDIEVGVDPHFKPAVAITSWGEVFSIQPVGKHSVVDELLSRVIGVFEGVNPLSNSEYGVGALSFLRPSHPLLKGYSALY